MNLLDRRVEAALRDRKLADRKVDREEFIALLRDRVSGLGGAYDAYQQELRRFLPTDQASTVLENPAYWEYALGRLKDILTDIITG